MDTSHPLAKISSEAIELAIAQALSELSGQRADVTLRSVEHTGGLMTAGESRLQVLVSFRPDKPEEGEAEH